MACLLTSSHPSLFSPNPYPHRLLLPLSRHPKSYPSPSSLAPGIPDEWGEKTPPEPEEPSEADPPKDEDEDEWGRDPVGIGGNAGAIADDWGEKGEPEPETPSSSADPPKDEDEDEDEDEWGREPGEGGFWTGNGSPVPEADKLGELKQCLVDSIYGTEFGFRASADTRAEILELVNQLEAENPTPAPTEAPELLDGKWILLYTAFSELLPLLAVGTTPLLKVKQITQEIDTKSMKIVNSTTLSSPFASFTFSASASFEVRSPSRIKVQFEEGTFQPPSISSTVDLPEQVDILGQKISLRPVQQSLNPIQEALANITRTISGQRPLTVPLPGNRAEAWLLTTYLDEDFRISRGDGGLFILAKEGSPLLDQLSQ
uniref:Plastid lipid-associated protein/fibrillin conserved domain-containing protein n=1 Tax=Ananas comosus var. bracteatus TaxID=296719 RepID=A0A6V7QZ36_ANACO